MRCAYPDTTGTYKVVVDGDNNATGNYKFRLLDETILTPISLDTEITGAIDQNNIGTTGYKFTATAGQHLYLNTGAGQYPNAWIIYKPNGEQVTYGYIQDNYYRDDFEFDVPTSGDYLFFIEGNGAANTNYKFTLTDSQFTTGSIVIGNTVTGNIAKQGQQNTYNFSGVAGQELHFDILNRNGNNTAYLYNQSGTQIFARNLYDLDAADLIVLKETGNYRLVIDGNGATTDAYSFRLLDVKASANNITLDTDVTGQLTSGQETKFYQFAGSKGQKLYLDWLTSSPNTQWSLYNSAGHLLDNRGVSDYETTLANNDTYTIAIRGYNDGVVEYSFRLITSTVSSTPIAIEGNNTPIVNGTIAKKGETDEFTFSGVAGAKIFYDQISLANATLRVFSPTGVEIGKIYSPYDVDGFYQLIETGTYRVVVDGNGENTGDYSFRFLNSDRATILPLNTPTTGSLALNSSSSNLYSFSGAVGQHVYIDAGGGDGNNIWVLYNPNGEYITRGTVGDNYYDDYEFDLTSTGQYTISVLGNGVANSNYRISVNAKADVATLGLGNLISSNISQAGERDTYNFSGKIGQQLYFDALTGNGNIKAQLFSPTGTLVKDGNTGTDWGGLVLTETGDYQLVIDGVGSTVGNYSFKLSERSAATTLTIGQTVSDSLSDGNGNKYYQINGRSGQVLKFDLSASNWAGANWVVYDPAGNPVATPAANSPDFQVALPGTGIYTLGILGNSNSPVSYSFQVSDVTPATVANTGFGTIQSGTYGAGELKEYNFTAKAGTVLLADWINDGSFGYYTGTRLVNPDGTYGFDFLSYQVSYYGEVAPVVLQQTGSYKIQTYNYWGGADSYKYQLLELPKQFGATTNYLELGEVISGSLARGEDKVYTFQANAGEKVLLNGISGYGVNANLYDALGNRVFGVGNLQSDDSGLYTLQAGIYNLVVATSAYTGDYSFQLLDSNFGQKIDDNIAQVGSIANGQVGKFFKVTANAGDKLYFDSVSSTPASGQYWNYRWQLFDAGGKALFNTYQNTDAAVTVSTTGEYYLYLQGGADSSKLDYNFRLFTHSDTAADIITPGTGTGSTGTDNLGLFNVKLGATDSRGASSTQDYQVKLWADPNNTNPVITSPAVTKFALTDQGYRYQLTSIDADGDKVLYQLLDAPTGAVIDKDTGELLWIATTNVKPGDKVNFKVRVNDRRGGTDTQTFTVDVFGNLGTIQGAVFDDLNSNGLRDTKLVKGDNPAIVLAIDVSGSTIAPFYGTSRSKTISTVLEAEIAAAELMVDNVIAQGGGDKVKFAIIPLTTNPTIQDMDLTTPGVQIYTTANADRNGNGIADIREILESYRPNGGSNFTKALTQVDNLFSVFTGDPNLIFLSDGYATLDPVIATTVVNDIKTKGGNVSAFGIGEASSIETLQKIDPTAIKITDFQQLVKIFSGFDDNYAIEPLKQNVTVYLDTNNNGSLDPDEPNQITRPNPTVSGLINTSYNYSFNNLLPGNYTVRLLVPNGYAQTTPNAIIDTVTVNGGEFTHLAGIGKITPPVNVDPVFITTAPTNTKLAAGGVFIYRANAVDNNADPLTYSLINAPTGMTVDATTGVVVWNPTLKQVENYYQELAAEQARLTAIGRGAYAPTKVTFDTYLRVSDGVGGQALQVLHLELLPNNRAPIFTSTPTTTTPQIGKVFEYIPTAVDPDQDPISYSLVGNFNPPGVTVDPTTGKVTWTPTAAQLGSQQISLQVSDSKGGSSIQKLELTVINPVANRAPEITSTPRTQTGSGQVYVYQVAATDADGDKLTYSLTNPPAGMVIDTKGLITWTPTAAQAGVKNVAVTVSDGTLTTQQTYVLTVGNTPINHSPEITSTPTFTTNLDKTYSYQLTGKDIDNDTLIWSLDNPPKGMVIDSSTGIIKWNPTSTQLGTHTVAVRLTDAYGLYVGQEYTLTVNGVNTPPQIQSTPNTVGGLNSPYKYQVKAVDLEGDVLKYTLGRRPNGMVVNSDTGLITWTPNATQIGTQIIDVLVTDIQGAVSTQTYNLVVGNTPINQPPTIASTPKFTADINSKYQYQVVGVDPENQQITYSLTTAPAGMVIDASTGLITWNSPTLGTTNIKITATDPSGGVAVQEYTLTGKQNHAPVISSMPTTQVTIGNTYRYDVVATDSDNDALVYSLDNASKLAGVTIDKLGRITWQPTSTNIGIKPVTVTVTDTSGAVVTQTYNLEVLADNTAPVVNLVRGTNIADIGETISFQVQATDNVGIKSTQLLINNQAVALDGNGVGTYLVTTAGVVTAQAIVTDVNGNVSTKSTTTNVIDPTDVEAPNISLDLSGIVDGIITGRTDIKGNVTDTNLDYYTLEVARWGTDNWQEVFRGTNNVTNGSLGKFDPSLLENDSYRVRLTAFDTGGHGSQVEDQIDVTGDLKLGNFRLSFTDLTIPVTGIPISLTRTYDSLTSGTTDDFGYGWRMEFRDTDLRTSLKKDETYEQLDYRTVGFNFGTRIYITLPGGKREGFTFEPKQVQGDFGGVTGGRLYYPSFVSDKGVTSTLTVPGAEIKANTNKYSANAGEFSGNPNGVLLYKEGKLFNLAGRPYVPQDDGFGNRYLLTTKDGTVYEINATSGDLESVTDTNGNKLTYSDYAIESSTGQKIVFDRDARGRITSVTDPLGKVVKYEYNDRGDLVSVTDRDGNTTLFGYNASRAHYLEKIVDPLGREAVKTEYDEQGRLKKTSNAGGNGVEFVYDPANSVQTVKDALGNPTTYEYDKRGNVVTEVDALGGIKKRTYDDENNMLSETDAEGRTTSYTFDSQGNQLSRTDGNGKTYYYTYGANGRVTSIVDPLGNTTKFTLDGRGNILTKTDAEGYISTYTYDGYGNRTSTTNALGQTTADVYDRYGNLTQETDALGHIIKYTYDRNGNRLTETKTVTTATGEVRTLVDTKAYDGNGKVTSWLDAEGNFTQYQYNKDGKQMLVIDALGRKTASSYDSDGRLIETIFEDGLSNHFTYDANGKKTQSIDREGRIITFKYDALGNPTDLISPDDTPNDPSDNPRKHMEYDKAGNLTTIVDEQGNRQEWILDGNRNIIGNRTYIGTTPVTITGTFDAAGRQTSSTDALNHTTRFVYDKLGRLVETLYADGGSSKTVYDAIGNETIKIDRANRQTKYEYDALKHLIAVVDPTNSRTAYSYDELGDLISEIDANNHQTKYEYDGIQRRTAIVRPLGQRSTAAYDRVGNLISTTDFNGQATTYTYDRLNLLTTKQLTDGTQTLFTYTPTGKLKTVADDRGITAYSYNGAGQIATVTNPDRQSIGYTYDAPGHLASVTTAAGTTSYSYGAFNRLERVTDAQGGITTYSYDVLGNLISTKLADGITESRTYDTLNRLVSLTNTNAQAQVISSYAYTLDAVGNKTQVVENNGRRINYTYDLRDRLLSEQITDANYGNRTFVYTYDAVGNRLSLTDSLAGNTTYSYNNNDWLLTETQGTEVTQYAYDHNGSLLSKYHNVNDKVAYTWNLDRRLVGVETTDASGTHQSNYSYDASGNRVSQTVDGVKTNYLVDTNRSLAQVAAEYDSSGIKASYTYAGGVISQASNGVRSFYVNDGHSGVRLIADEGGNVTDAYNYDAYGNLLQSAGANPAEARYRGDTSDSATGLQYLRARYYDPSTGRFLSTDPFEGTLNSPVSRHRYLYGNANPITYSDPSGNFATSIGEISTVLAILETLTIFTAGQAAVGQIARLSGEIEWEGKLSSISAKGEIFGIDVNTGFSLLDLKTKESNETSPFLYPDIEAQFRGKWLQVFGGVGITGEVTFPSAASPDSLSVLSSVKAFSPRIFKATPVAFSGGYLIGSISSGIGSAKVFSAGFGRGGSAGLSDSTINRIDSAISLKEGISIPVWFFPVS